MQYGTVIACCNDDKVVRQIYLVTGTYSDVIQVRSIKGIQLQLTVEAVVLALSENDELYLMDSSRKDNIFLHHEFLSRLNMYINIYVFNILSFNKPVIGAIAWIFNIEARPLEYKIVSVDYNKEVVYLKRSGVTISIYIKSFMQHSCYLYVMAARRIWK